MSLKYGEGIDEILRNHEFRIIQLEKAKEFTRLKHAQQRVGSDKNYHMQLNTILGHIEDSIERVDDGNTTEMKTMYTFNSAMNDIVGTHQIGMDLTSIIHELGYTGLISASVNMDDELELMVHVIWG